LLPSPNYLWRHLFWNSLSIYLKKNHLNLTNSECRAARPGRLRRNSKIKRALLLRFQDVWRDPDAHVFRSILNFYLHHIPFLNKQKSKTFFKKQTKFLKEAFTYISRSAAQELTSDSLQGKNLTLNMLPRWLVSIAVNCLFSNGSQIIIFWSSEPDASNLEIGRLGKKMIFR